MRTQGTRDARAADFGSRGPTLERFESAWVLIAALLWIIACFPETRALPEVPTGTHRVHDLLEDLTIADISKATRGLDFGTEAAASMLVSGWATNEEDAHGSFVWSLGTRSEFEVVLTTLGDHRLELELASLDFPGAPEQRVQVEVAGHRVTEFVAPKTPGQVILELPAEVVRLGRNRVSLLSSWSRTPKELGIGSLDARPLSLSVYRVGIRSVSGSAEGDLEVIDQGVVFPPDLSVGYSYEVPDGSGLAVGPLIGGELVLQVTDSFGAVDYRLSPSESTQWIALAEGLVGVQMAAVASSVLVSSLSIKTSSEVLDERAASTNSVGSWESNAEAELPDIFLYVIDTLRADHLGVYGYERETSPAIDRLAAEGVTFEEARAQSSWTRSSVVSLLTGRTPPGHGVIGRDDALDPEIPTLAGLLAEAGYQTAAWVTNGNVSGAFGLDSGFEKFNYLAESKTYKGVHKPASVVK